MRWLWIICLVALSSVAMAEKGVVTSVTDGRITINRGSLEGVSRGSTWTVYRDGQAVGQAVVESTREYSARAVLQGTAAARVGDVVSSDGTVAAVEEAPAQTESRSGKESTRYARRTYERMLKQRTRSKKFTSQMGGGGLVDSNMVITGLQAANTVRMLDMTNNVGLNSVGFNSGWYNYWAISSLANTAVRTFEQRRMRDRMKQKLRITATYWDDPLVQAYGGYLAVRDDLDNQAAALKNLEVSQEKGTDQYAVFEITFENVGKQMVTTSPVEHHLLLENADGKFLQPSDFDRHLNTELRPGEKIHGYIYYPKISVMGMNEVKLRVNGLAGANGEIVINP